MKRRTPGSPSVTSRAKLQVVIFSSLLVALQLLGMAGLAAAQDATPGASPVGEATELALVDIPMAPGSEAEGAVPDATVTFNLGGEIDTGDPQVMAFLNEIEIASKVWVPLLALNEENLPASAGAESATVSADGTVYTFTIRDGMTYTDGEPVTAGNYAYALKRACSPEVAGNYSNILYAITGCEAWRSADLAGETAGLEAALDESIVAVDDSTLEIHLDYAAGYFPYVMTTWVTYPVREDLVEGNGADWWRDISNYVGNGPFKVVSHTDNQEWVFERNEDYFRGAPGIQTLVYKEVDSPETALLAYQQGEFDLIGPSSTQLPQVEADPVLSEQLARQSDASTYYMAFNNASAPFDDVQVRQAFSYAMNRQQYIDQIANGVGIPAGTFLYEGIPGYQTDFQQSYDPEMAKQLLADAGYPEGEGFPVLQLYYNSESAASQQVATFWSQNFQQVLGVTVEPTPIDVAQLQSLRTNRDPSLLIWLGNWFEDYPHPQNWLSLVYGPGSTRAPLGWDNQEYYDLVTEADRLPIEEAIPLYEQADALLAEQAPVAFYLHGESLVLVSPQLQGYVSYPTSVVDTRYQIEKIYKVAE
ncbi:MAG TPA: peptide ABC transporter substrate-binding protein [Thermomicrobiales bacterium]|nr:peptide ABC transporter substrate-binding protein [Thermomicrobiales bacterium]